VRSVRCSGAFTLIELLIVVSIIALLLSVLLPSLTQARERSRAVVCLSNIRQVALAFHVYEKENRYIPGTYWQGALNLDWGGRNNAAYLQDPNRFDHPIETSVLRAYISHVDRILECPTGQREANTFFDYTVIIRLAGARTDLPWRMTWLQEPTQANSQRTFQAIPLLIEEDRFFYNQLYDDGSWANKDQVSDRHNRAGNIGYLDASAARFKPPKGHNPEIEEGRDLKTQHLQLWANGKSYPVWYSSAAEFGWANRPR